MSEASAVLHRTDLRERVQQLRKVLLRTPSICTERARFWTESYKETKADPPVVRQAKALARTLGNMTIFIGEGELLVGNVTSKIRGGGLLPEINSQWLVAELDQFPVREWDRFERLCPDSGDTRPSRSRQSLS